MGFARRLWSRFDHRRRFVVGAFGAWILVAAASAGAAPGERGWVGVPDLSWVLVAFFALLLPVGVVLLLHLRKGEGETHEGVRRRPASYWMVALTFLAVFVVLRAISDDVDDAEEPEQLAPEIETVDADERSGTAGDGGRARPADTSQIVAAAAAAAVAAAALWWLRRTSSVVAAPATHGVAAVAPAIDRALADLDLGDDPRSAVLRAYASLEGALAERDLPRRANETAAEHLRRTLGSLPVDADELVELGRLYERARFSSATTPAADRDRARAILERARSDIRRPRLDTLEARG